VRLPERMWETLSTLTQGLSRAQTRLHFSRVGWSGRTFFVVAMMLCGAVALLAWGIFGALKAQRGTDHRLPAGDLAAVTTPAGHDEALPAATTAPAGHDEALPAATTTPAGHDEAIPAATTTRAGPDEALPAATITALADVTAPKRIVIERIGVDAPVIALGLDANSSPEVPKDPDLVAWYDFTAKPGQGSNAVFAGHVDWTVNGRPVTAVFWGLRELDEGDVVRLLLEDGSELGYRVTHNLAIGYDDPNAVEVMYRTPNDVITLISCGGTWVPDLSMPLGGNYTHRVVVRAERVT
jgi:LPXTG-site transpeptidase (sortase) family protein